LYRDLDRTAQSLDALAPGDGDAWRRFAAPYLERFEPLREALLGRFAPVRTAAGLAVGLRPRGLAELVRLVLTPVQAVAGELFSDQGSRAWLYGSAMHGDVPPGGSGSTIPALFLNLLGHAVGWPSPEGGAGRLAGALIGYLESLGGVIRTGAEVVQITTDGRRLRGVLLADGTRLPGRFVIADVMPSALARLAEAALPRPYASALRRYRPGPATLKVDWALSGPIPWTAPEARHAGTVHVGGGEQEMLRSASPGASLPERPFMLLGQQSIADPTRAPAGRHTAWAYTRGPQTLDWTAEVDRHVERMETQMERFAPGFRELVLARHVLTPADLQRRNANLIGGDVGGGSYSLDQALLRPVARFVPYRTPLRGLYIASAATFPGGAVHGVPGRAAARLALARWR
jgi:phytoene dehydrogenase-like protein